VLFGNITLSAVSSEEDPARVRIVYQEEAIPPTETTVTADARNRMITFSCGNCGKKLRVPDSYGGKKGKCPRCGRTITIPETQKVADLLNAPAPGLEEQETRPYKLTFLDTPEKTPKAVEPADEPDQGDTDLPYTEVPLVGSLRREPESLPKRRLPWVIDILLFPTSILALVVTVLVLIVPIVVRIFLLASGSFILITFWFGWIVVILLYLYAFWYFCESVRQSAEGKIRAPSAVTDVPGLWDMLWQFFRAIVSLLFFFLPMIRRRRVSFSYGAAGHNGPRFVFRAQSDIPDRVNLRDPAAILFPCRDLLRPWLVANENRPAVEGV